MENEVAPFFEEDSDASDDLQIAEYDITAVPNDFNILTIYSFLESGSVRIPGFQRNYVWDIMRASKLIESLILGLPVPQIFLYEATSQKFLVIDGQQRLMSIYYFIKQRFPRKEKRSEIRSIFDQEGNLPNEIIHDDAFFENFRLKLSKDSLNRANRFSGLSYSTLGTHKTQFELRTLRNVIIKQNAPAGDDSSMFEVFNRLNTGGINLKPQEIRTSMYHSPFYEALYKLNSEKGWRRLLVNREPDLHMKDIEVLLRAFSMLLFVDNYAPSMVKFLNNYSRHCRGYKPEEITFYSNLFRSFLKSCEILPGEAFLNKKRRFNVALFEATFAATCREACNRGRMVNGSIVPEQVEELALDTKFANATMEGTTKTANVKSRIDRAKEILDAL